MAMTFFKIVKSIGSKEWLAAGLLALAVYLLSLLPFFYGWLKTGSGSVFTGLRFAMAEDWFFYFSLVEQAKNGQFLFFDLYSSWPQTPVIQPVWFLVGVLARVFNLSAPLAIHLSRLPLAVAYSFAAYIFIALYFAKPAKRLLALVFVFFSSGWGFFFVYRLAIYPHNIHDGRFRWPMDLWLADNYSFFSLYSSPHLIAANILLILIFLFTVLFSQNENYAYALAAGFCGLLIFSFHPFQIIKIFSIIGLFFIAAVIFSKKKFRPLFLYYLIFAVVSSPSIFYYLYLLLNDENTRIRAAQNVCLSPDFFTVFISFGGLAVFAGLAVYFLVKEKKIFNAPYLFLAVWAACQPLLFYLPVNYQRRLGLGAQFPLALLSLYAFFYLYQRHRRRLDLFVVPLIIAGAAIFFSSTVFILAADYAVYSRRATYSYLSHDLVKAFDYLRQESLPDAVIFSSPQTGNILPGYAVRHVYVGHAVETPFYKVKTMEAQWFYQKDRAEEVEKQFLRARGIDYLFFGPYERLLGVWQGEKNYLQKVYAGQTAQIYKVEK